MSNNKWERGKMGMEEARVGVGRALCLVRMHLLLDRVFDKNH